MLMLLVRNYEVQKWHFDVRTDHPLIMIVAITNTVLQVMLYGLQIFWLYILFRGFFRTILAPKNTNWMAEEERKLAAKAAEKEKAKTDS